MSSLKKAMARAREDRDAGRGSAAGSAPEGAAPAAAAPGWPSGLEQGEVECALDRVLTGDGVTTAPRVVVNPTYSRTRVETTDVDHLRRHKVVPCRSDGGISDQVKILRTQVLQRMQETGANSLLVTSANPGEGKTFTATNLAVSMAQALDRTTLLVDTDLRSPDVGTRFGLNGNPGLAAYLEEGAELADLLVNPGIPKLTVLPAGRPRRNSSELLGSPRMEALVGEMKARYPDRFLVFDGTSLLSCADAQVFARYVDAVVLVVEGERTPAADVARALDLLEGLPLLGLVYNKAR